MSDKERVGFIGVGLMGHGMAKNILEAGYPLTIMGNRNRKPVDDLVGRGATEVTSPKEMAETCDVIHLCVTSSVQIEDLCRREDGLLAGAREGLIVIDCSTADPTSTMALAEEFRARGTTMIDAPLGQTPKEAQTGNLNTFVGSDPETLEKVRPILETWAANITHIGGVGAGHKAKLINNFLSIGYNALFAEAFTACRKAGIDLQKFRDLIAGGGNNSGMFQRMSNYVIDGDPEAHLFTLSNCLKDIRYFTQLADDSGMAAPMAGAIKATYNMAVAQGAGDEHMPMLTDYVSMASGGERTLPKQ